MFKSTGLPKHLKQKDPSNEIKKQQLGLLGKHLSRNQMIELTSKIHSWYLFEWDRPATLSLRESPAAIAIWMLPERIEIPNTLLTILLILLILQVFLIGGIIFGFLKLHKF